MYAQLKRGSFSDWADHVFVLVYAVLGGLYAIYLVVGGFFLIIRDVNLMTTAPTGGVLGDLIGAVILVPVALYFLNMAFAAFRRLLVEGPNPDPAVVPKKAQSRVARALENALLPDSSATATAARNASMTPKQRERAQRNQARLDMAQRLSQELEQARAAKRKKKG